MMRKRLFLLFVSMVAVLASAQISGETDFLKKITSKSYCPEGVDDMVPMADGEHYAQMDAEGKRVFIVSYKSGAVRDTLLDLTRVKDCPLESMEGFALDSLEQKVLVYNHSEKVFRRAFVADYYVYNRKRNKMEPLSVGGKQQDAVFSPNGRMVAFARENNLYIKKLDFNTEIAVTTDGEKGKVINGTPDWVYEEEFVRTRFFEWAPDSKSLAYVRFDELDVKNFSFQWFGEGMCGGDGYPSLQTYKYPRAGTKNAQVEVRVYDVFYKSTKTMDFGKEVDSYVPAIQWGLTADVLFAFRLDRNQAQLDLFAFNPRSTVGKIVLTDKSDYYIDYANIDAFTVLPNGRIVWMSESDGYRHLYLYNWQNGKKLRQLTSGKWDVTDFYGFDAKKNVVYFQSSEPSALERAVYSVDAKGKKTCLTAKSGTHSAQFASGFGYFVDAYTSKDEPFVYSVCNAAGTPLRTLEDNAGLKKEFGLLNLPEKEFFDFKNSDGLSLNGWMLKPVHFDPSVKYPVLMVQYSGPDSQEVRNRWSVDWEYYLAQNGYLVVCVDGRGTGARGEEFRKCTYRHLGEYEVADQVFAAKYVSSLPFVDASRIGIWGWSYGGYTVLSCLIHGDGLFKVGIAVAPVTDWRLYDSAYAERYMRRPQENFMGYDKASLLDKAADVKGRLLLVHGTADDNVHLQNTMLFAEKMIDAGVQFDMMLYPDKNHSILGNSTRSHLYTKMSRFLFEHL